MPPELEAKTDRKKNGERSKVVTSTREPNTSLRPPCDKGEEKPGCTGRQRAQPCMARQWTLQAENQGETAPEPETQRTDTAEAGKEGETVTVYPTESKTPTGRQQRLPADRRMRRSPNPGVEGRRHKADQKCTSQAERRRKSRGSSSHADTNGRERPLERLAKMWKTSGSWWRTSTRERWCSVRKTDLNSVRARNRKWRRACSKRKTLP